jgi:SAM-dependent methyltransferase
MAHLVRGRSKDTSALVAADLERLRKVEAAVLDGVGLRLEGLSALDVGAGQLLAQMTYFAQKNTVSGIDTDVIVRGFDLPGYARMLRKNGSKRVVKTLGRKALLIDARYRRELARQMGVPRLAEVRPLEMNAAKMTFSDRSFEFVYSMAVFQHLEDPAAVLDEMIRVLKPGGAIYFDFILYTGPTGSHDVHYLGGDEDALPAWAHLRPRFQSLVQSNAYLNRLRLPEWREIIDQRMPAFKSQLIEVGEDGLMEEAESLRKHELCDYSLEELLTSKVIVVWRKPESSTG